ncbi:MAG TPA: DUF2497 domain-containing protein [Beijerinckiaceae bacterium]|nr:DUF2497 domain-containing protein [Beijerinckiaceae bacterium]
MGAANAKTQDPSMEEILASIRRIIADDQEAARPQAPAASEPPSSAADDILDLAELAPARPPLTVDPNDISFRDLEPAPAEPSAAAPPPVTPAAEAARPAQPIEPARSFVQPPPLAREAPKPEPAERLISGATDAAVTDAFNMLAHTVLSNNARTLEDLVREMLKPMLRAWLDDNLPSLVERLVRAEIERVARGRP